MSKPIVLQDRFDRMARDYPRSRMPAGTCWNLVDWIPGGGNFAPLAKRGGYTYESQALASVLSGTDYVDTVHHAPFVAGGQLLAVAVDNGAPATKLLQINSTSSTTDRGTVNAPLGPMIFYRNKVYIPEGGGSAVPYVYAGTSNATVLGGSPPAGSAMCIYKDRLVLGGSTAEPQRVHFSAAGNGASWDTTLRYIDTSAPVMGLYALRNAILVFHPATLERIIGTIPPPGSDMSLQPLSDVGLPIYSSWSLAGTDEFVCFANGSGAYLTDGSSVADLTEQGNVKSYWLETMGTVGGVFAGGYFRGFYFVNNLSTHATMVCHVTSRRWCRLTNMNIRSFARKIGANEELYFGQATDRVCSMSSIFNPAAGVKNDADGTAVTPVLETPYFDLNQSKSTIRRVYAHYDIRDAASDNPTWALSYITSPEETSYTAIVDQAGSAYPLAETTEASRVRRLVRKASFGIGLKITQSNASATSRLYSLELDAHNREGSRV